MDFYDDWTSWSRPLFNSFAIYLILLSKDDKEEDDILNMLDIKWTPSLMLPVAPRPRLMKLPPQLDCLFSGILQIKFFFNPDFWGDFEWFRPLFWCRILTKNPKKLFETAWPEERIGWWGGGGEAKKATVGQHKAPSAFRSKGERITRRERWLF